MSNDAGDTSTAPPRPDLPPHPKARRPVLCPYCGEVSADVNRCTACAGFFDPLSRQASQNAMGAWYIRDAARPFRPGCSYETLKDLVRRGRITPETVLRGPTTRQFWTFAGRAPSVANLLGRCHNCHAEVKPDDYMCAACGAAFTPESDRQHLGLAPIHLLPNQATPEVIAAVSAARQQSEPHPTAPAPSSAPPARSRRPDGDYTRLRRQIIAQWAVLILLFVAVAGLAAWLITTFARQQRPAVIPAVPTEQPPAAAAPSGAAVPEQPGATDEQPAEPLATPPPTDGPTPPADPPLPDSPPDPQIPSDPDAPPDAEPEPPAAAGDAPDPAALLVALLTSEQPDPADIQSLLSSASQVDPALSALAEKRLNHPDLRALP